MPQTRFSANNPTFFYTEAFLYPKTQKRPAEKRLTCEFVEPTAGLEPATYALRVRCSTN